MFHFRYLLLFYDAKLETILKLRGGNDNAFKNRCRNRRRTYRRCGLV